MRQDPIGPKHVTKAKESHLFFHMQQGLGEAYPSVGALSY